MSHFIDCVLALIDDIFFSPFQRKTKKGTVKYLVKFEDLDYDSTYWEKEQDIQSLPEFEQKMANFNKFSNPLIALETLEKRNKKEKRLEKYRKKHKQPKSFKKYTKQPACLKGGINRQPIELSISVYLTYCGYKERCTSISWKV